MTEDHYVAPTIMDDQAKLVEGLIIGDEAIGAVKGIVMGVAIHLERSLHGLAAEAFRIRVLSSGHMRVIVRFF